MKFTEVAEQSINEAQKNNSPNSEAALNKLHDDKEKDGVLYRLLDLKIPYLQLFSYFHYRKITNTYNRPSNGLIKNYHKHIKHHELLNQFPRSLLNYVEIKQEKLENKIGTIDKEKLWRYIHKGNTRKRSTENDDIDEMTDVLVEEKYGKKKKQTPPTSKPHSHFNRLAFSQALTPNISESQENLNDSEDSMSHFLPELREERVAAHRMDNYNASEIKARLDKARASNNDRYKSGILKELNYYNSFLSFLRTGTMWLKASEFNSIIVVNPSIPRSGWLDSWNII